MAIDWDDAALAHEQIAASYRAQIASGALKPGDKLPLREELAEAWDVSHSTISKAVALLRAEHLVIRRPARGLYIA